MSSKPTVLVLEGSREGLSRLRDLHRQGKLSEQLGIPVFGVEETDAIHREGVTSSSETEEPVRDSSHDRGKTGRWLVPAYTDLPTLLIMDAEARATLCGYPSSRDRLGDLTAMELIRLTHVVGSESWGDSVLRQWRLGDKIIYGMYGWPGQVATQIRKMARRHGLHMASVLIPSRAVDQVSLYIIGAHLVGREESRQEEHDEEETNQGKGDE